MVSQESLQIKVYSGFNVSRNRMTIGDVLQSDHHKSSSRCEQSTLPQKLFITRRLGVDLIPTESRLRILWGFKARESCFRSYGLDVYWHQVQEIDNVNYD